MAGNLQVLLGQEAINAYATPCKVCLPPFFGDLACFCWYAWCSFVTAYQLIKENRAARPRQRGGGY